MITSGIHDGEFDGNYVTVDADDELMAGRYVINLTSRSDNYEVATSQAFAAVNPADVTLQWDADETISFKEGDRCEIGIAYEGNRWIEAKTEYDNSIISLNGENLDSNLPLWYAEGLKGGETQLSFGLVGIVNTYGFANYNDSPILSRKIVVESLSGIENIATDGTEVEVRVVDHVVYILNMPEGATARVFDVQGRLITKTTRDVIQNLEYGFYIINVAGHSFKVAI